MSLNEVDLTQPASDRFAIEVIGGNTVFLADRILGHKLYLGPRKSLTAPEFRVYFHSVKSDLSDLPLSNFCAKYGVQG